MSLSVAQRALLAELIRRDKGRHTEQCARSLPEFIRAAWPILEPGTTYLHNWHIDAIAEHLEAVTRGEIRRLLINMPPRYMKSIAVSVLWPVWEWITVPEQRWVFASYSGSLAIKHSVDRRTVIRSDWYQANWGDRFQLSDDQDVKTEFLNTRRGVMVATSVGGSSTGKGGNRLVCLAGDTEISTDHGRIAIADIVDEKLPVQVLSFDHCHNKYVYGKIEAYESTAGRPSVRVRFTGKRSIDATEDHPVFVRGVGYVAAAQLKPGDRIIDAGPLRSLREAGGTDSGSTREADQWDVLRARLSRRMAEGPEQSFVDGRQPEFQLPEVRQPVPRQAQPTEGWPGPVLFSLLQGRTRSGVPLERSGADSGLQYLRNDIQDIDLSSREAEILLAIVRGCSPLNQDRRPEQSPLHSRQVGGEVLERIPSHCSPCARSRWARLSSLWPFREGERREPGLSSHRLRQGSRRDGQSDLPLQMVSRVDARWPDEPQAMDGSIVESIERIDAPSRVFNVRVAEWHNYFAAGVLVHNCDDPHNPKQAESDAERETAVEWLDQTFYSRQDDKKTAAIVVVMQRLHERDASARCLEQNYTHLCLPAVAETRTVVPMRSGDKIREKGDILWPEREGPAEIAETEKALGPYGFAGQYQQRPRPKGGGFFKYDWFKKVKAVPAIGTRIRYWDTAGTEGGGDFTVGTRMLRSQANQYYIEHVHRGQWSPGRRNGEMKGVAQKDTAIVSVWLERESGIGGIERTNETIRMLAGFNVHAELATGSKENRADGLAAQAEAGNVFIVEGDWNHEFLKELCDFPVGAHDDQVDSAAGAFNKLASLPVAVGYTTGGPGHTDLIAARHR
jgi:predicted phage terminase large subunit-like protein